MDYIVYIYVTDSFMKKYLLLRNNKQSGPYTYDELMEMGLKTQDLIWIEGKSASWRYPGEFDEFKTHPSFLKEQAPEQHIEELQNNLLLFRREGNIPVHSFPDEELIEFPTMARFLDPDGTSKPEPKKEKIISTGILPVQSGIPDAAPEISPIFDEKIDAIADEPVAEEKIEIKPSPEKEIPPVVAKRVSVTLPAAVSDKTFVVIHPKAIEKMPVSAPEILPAQQPIAASITPVEQVQEAEIIPVPVAEKIIEQIPEIKRAVVKEKIVVAENIQPGEITSESPIVYMPASQPASGNLMQKLAVAAGIVSLISVAVLIANSIFNPDAYNYVVNNKTADKLPIAVSPAPDTQGEYAESVNETAVPSNTNLQVPDPTNTTLPETGIQPQKVQSKKVKVNDKEPVPENAGMAENAVNTNITAVSNESKVDPADPKEETRQNIKKLVNYELNNFKVNAFGGVSDFEVVINNNSAYPLDLVVVELKYIQSNKKIFKTERLEFKGVAPKGKQSIGVAKTNRGIKVETTITSISSRELDLVYHQ